MNISQKLFDQYVWLLSEFAAHGPDPMLLEELNNANQSLHMYRLRREYEATKRVRPEICIEALEARRPLTPRDRTYLDAAAHVNRYIANVLQTWRDGPPNTRNDVTTTREGY